jgi:hypothetical protein
MYVKDGGCVVKTFSNDAFNGRRGKRLKMRLQFNAQGGAALMLI